EVITQGFFAQLLERRKFSALRKEKGRLRSYLLGALKYFVADEQRRAMAIKRGKGQRLIPLEELRAGERIDMEPSDPMTAEMIYERRWALTVLERVLGRLKDEYRAAGNAALFDALKELLPDEQIGRASCRERMVISQGTRSFSSRRRHTRWPRDWSSDVCSSDLIARWRANRYGTFGPDDRRNDLRTPVGFDGFGARARPIER